MSDEMEILKRVYDRFNARDMESVLGTRPIYALRQWLAPSWLSMPSASRN
jgi:hypothetical protein